MGVVISYLVTRIFVFSHCPWLCFRNIWHVISSEMYFCQIPSIHWQLTSERVLTMEFCHGGFITDTKYIRKHNISIDDVGSCVTVLSHFMHSVFHPSNTHIRVPTPAMNSRLALNLKHLKKSIHDLMLFARTVSAIAEICTRTCLFHSNLPEKKLCKTVPYMTSGLSRSRMPMWAQALE